MANMSHETRTPMNAIVGLSRLALEDNLPSRARGYLDKMHSSALALMGILDDVLDYAKIEAGQLRSRRSHSIWTICCSAWRTSSRRASSERGSSSYLRCCRRCRAVWSARMRAVCLHGVRILVVEDNPVNQVVVAELLKLLGVEITVADDGADALKAMRDGGAGCFDAVLMDLHMPRMDGFETTRRIQALPRVSSIPVIAISAAVLPEDRAQSFAAGMVDHVAKPIVAERLVEVLFKWLKPRQSIP